MRHGADDDATAVRDGLEPWGLCEALGLVGAGRRDHQRQAAGLLVRCAFDHDERTPSMSVTRGAGGTGVRVRCFGCGKTGDGLTLIAAVHGLDVRRDFRRVLELGAPIAGVRLDGPQRGWRRPPPRRSPPPPPPSLPDATFDALFRAVAAACPPDALPPDAERYLAARGLLDLVRCAWPVLPAAWGALAAVRDAAVTAVGPEAWALSGLAAAADGSWLFKAHRLVIPWRDPATGLVTTLQRRLVRPPRDRREPKYVFATGRQPRHPFGAEVLAAGPLGPGAAVAFAEGAVDVVALRALCARTGRDWAVLGLPGVQAWRRSWAALAASRVAVLAFDADAAGDAAVAAVAADLRAAGAADVRRARPGGGLKDWAELLEASRHG